MDLLTQIEQIAFSSPLPATLLEVEQHFDAPKVPDVTAATRAAREDIRSPGASAGGRDGGCRRGQPRSRQPAANSGRRRSRLREAGLQPFVAPAMGSHGGATAAGQLDVLAQLGVNEESAARRCGRRWRCVRWAACRKGCRSTRGWIRRLPTTRC